MINNSRECLSIEEERWPEIPVAGGSVEVAIYMWLKDPLLGYCVPPWVAILASELTYLGALPRWCNSSDSNHSVS